MLAFKNKSPVVSSCPINLCLPQLGQLMKAAKFLISSLLSLMCLQCVEVSELRKQQKIALICLIWSNFFLSPLQKKRDLNFEPCLDLFFCPWMNFFQAGFFLFEMIQIYSVDGVYVGKLGLLPSTAWDQYQCTRWTHEEFFVCKSQSPVAGAGGSCFCPAGRAVE